MSHIRFAQLTSLPSVLATFGEVTWQESYKNEYIVTSTLLLLVFKESKEWLGYNILYSQDVLNPIKSCGAADSAYIYKYILSLFFLLREDFQKNSSILGTLSITLRPPPPRWVRDTYFDFFSPILFCFIYYLYSL